MKSSLSMAVLAVAVILAGSGEGALAQTNTYPDSPYPRVNPAAWYEVDPAWPQRPPGIGWGGISGLALDAQENVWIYTRTNPIVQVYAADGRYLKGWSSPGTNAVAHGLRIDRDGHVWLVDVGRHTVTKHAADTGRVLLTIGTVGEPGCDATHFFKPTDVAFAVNGDIYVSDGYGNARVAQFGKDGTFIREWGGLGGKPGQFSIPHSVVCDARGRLYVADRNNGRIQVFDTRGRLLEVWADIMVPWSLWLSPEGDIWACGSSPMTWGFDPKYPTAPLGCPPKDQIVVRFDSSGKVRQLRTFPKAADGEEAPGTLNWLHNAVPDSKGNLYCSDIIGRRVQKFLRKTDPAAAP